MLSSGKTVCFPDKLLKMCQLSGIRHDFTDRYVVFGSDDIGFCARAGKRAQRLPRLERAMDSIEPSLPAVEPPLERQRR